MCRVYTIARSCGHLEVQDAPKGIIPCPLILQSRKPLSGSKEVAQPGCGNFTYVRIPSWQACRVCIEELWCDVPGLLSTPDSQLFDEGSVEGIRESPNSTDDETRDRKSSSDSRASSMIGGLRNLHVKDVICKEVSLDELVDAMDSTGFGRDALLPSLPASTGDSFDLSCAILSPRPCIVAMPSLDDLVANAATIRKSMVVTIPDTAITVTDVKKSPDSADTITPKSPDEACPTKTDKDTASSVTPHPPSQDDGNAMITNNDGAHPVGSDSTPTGTAKIASIDDNGNDNGNDNDARDAREDDKVDREETPDATTVDTPIELAGEAVASPLPVAPISCTENTGGSASNSPTTSPTTNLDHGDLDPVVLPQNDMDESTPEDANGCIKPDISDGWCMVQVVEPIDLGEDIITVPTPYWDQPALSGEDTAPAMSAGSAGCCSSLGIRIPLPKILRFVRPV